MGLSGAVSPGPGSAPLSSSAATRLAASYRRSSKIVRSEPMLSSRSCCTALLSGIVCTHSTERVRCKSGSGVRSEFVMARYAPQR